MPRLSALKSAASDATAVSNVLRDRYGYQTTLLLNASRLEMLSALNDMREKLGANDNLLIYYAGHGELDGRQGLLGAERRRRRQQQDLDLQRA
jgi:hypothetical protein